MSTATFPPVATELSAPVIAGARFLGLTLRYFFMFVGWFALVVLQICYVDGGMWYLIFLLSVGFAESAVLWLVEKVRAR
jgi:hypothetical protein